MSTPNSSLRHRGQKEKAKANVKVERADEILDDVKQSTKQSVGSQWDYKIALAIITLLSFVTRFWGIAHPNEVVFDEVHFGKVGRHYAISDKSSQTAVRIILPPANILLRRPPSVWKAALRPHGLVCRL